MQSGAEKNYQTEMHNQSAESSSNVELESFELSKNKDVGFLG